MYIRILKGKPEKILFYATLECNLPLKYKDENSQIIEHQETDTYIIEIEDKKFKEQDIKHMDSWNPHIKDSYIRSREKPKSLEERIEELETRIEQLEQQKTSKI